ncbi:restriction endonuclease subunit S [Rhodanobacter sp. AS-Z3]|uniref:restriction endonuclease subunit S n=1 Tax=Rhodanobacter sp. AS-Z3 TaxID=3031330 RepID=UPI00247AED32|nr:restriction endonuclease subunit S [Rhodanobacter sp. AS-Z3]WEN15396.1 restriction endonuclease subunit S [Rhodanobacter sp. AS-Z3]
MALRFVVHAMSLPRYADYKDSGVAWIGEVPAHWMPYKVREFTQFCGGGTPSRDNLAFWNGDIPWVSPKDMKFERIKGAEECITDEGLSSSSSSLVDPGRLLMVVRSGILKHTIPVAINDVPVALNQDMKALRFSEQLATSDFFLRWVQGLNDVLLLAWAKQGATVESIEHAYLAGTIVPLPPLPEQSVIAAFLDRETGKIDALIAEQEKLLTLLAEKRQATISHAVTRGLNPSAPMQDSGVPWLGEVPAHWYVLRLASVYREIAELGNDELPILSVSIHDGVSDKELGDAEMDRKVTRSDDRSKYKRVAPNDLTYNMMRAWQGSFGTVMVHGQVSPAYVVARPLGEIRTMFVEQLLRTPQAIEQVRRYSRGITEFRLRLYWEEFKNIRIAVPPVAEQDEILSAATKEIADFNKLTGTVERAIILLKERRSALIAAAVTGKIDVRHVA